MIHKNQHPYRTPATSKLSLIYTKSNPPQNGDTSFTPPRRGEASVVAHPGRSHPASRRAATSVPGNPKSFLVVIAFITTLSSIAQQTNDLDPVTITASLHEQQTSKTGRNIVVIKGEKFHQLPVNSIDELLRYIPGIEIQSRGPMGAQSDIVIRGGTFQQVLVILDGIRLNDPNTGHFNSYIPIAPGEIERIEVLKGASSAIYGSEAVGGVIHIITKTFSTNKKKSREVLAKLGTGSNYMVNASFDFYSHIKNTAISIGGITNNTDGEMLRGIKGYAYNNTASASIHHTLNPKWSAALRGAYDNRRFAAQNFYTSFLSDTAEEEVTTFWNQGQLNYRGTTSKINVSLGYKDVKDKYFYNSLSIPNQNKSRLFQSLLVYEKKISHDLMLTTGAQFQNRIIRSNDRGNHDVKQAAAFAIANYTLANIVNLSPALRYDWDERGGGELVPQLNLSYHINRFQLRASLGKTIRHADFTERYNNYNKTYVAGGSIGNPDLEAERSESYEVGADYFLPDIKISATVFRRDQRRVIDWVPTPYASMPRQSNLSPAGNYALASNISTVQTSGAETDIQYAQQLAGNQKVWATLGLVWLQSNSSDGNKSFYISSHAQFLASFNLQWVAPYLAISVNGLYKHRDPREATAIEAKVTADYFILNAKAEGFLCNKRMSLFVQATNLFNKTYQDLLGAQMPGRWLSGGLTIFINHQK